MMLTKKNLALVFFSVLIVFSADFVLAEGQDAKIILKMATVAPKGHAMTRRMEDLNVDVRKATNNEVMFKIYWGGVQGDDNNIFRKIRGGQLHGGFFSGYSLGHIVPEVRVTEMPYLFANDDEVKYVRDKMQATMFEYFDKKGYVVLGSFIDIGFTYLFSKEPATSLSTMKNFRCWVPGEDTLAQSFFKAMDIQPVPLSVNDVMTSVSTNLIDSAPMTPFGAIAFRWYTKLKFVSDYPLVNIVGANIVSKKIWETITPQSREKILKIANKYCDKQKEDLRTANNESMKLLQKEGVKIVHVDPKKDPEKIKFLLDAGDKARESQVGVLYSRELMNKTLALVEEYRKKKPGGKSKPSVKK
ncbi:MAG: TRAP transporter substrate-binding protein DctP [Desulfobacteraceae bacterium]